MKKITYLSIVLAGLAFASCKKDRVCECTWSTTDPSAAGFTSTTETTYKKVKKGVAAENCENTTYQMTAPVAGFITTNDCKLK